MAVRETFSKFKATGRLKESRLEVVEGKFDDGVEYNTLRGKFILGVGDGEYTCEVYIRNKFAGDEHKTNSDYQPIADLMSCAPDTPIEVQLRTNRFNDYVGKTGKIVSIDTFGVQRVRILSEVGEEKFEGAIEGMVTKSIPEIVNEEETGRLKVELTGIGYNDKALPHNLYVDKELADDFKDTYEIGTTATFYIEVKTVSYGEKKTSSTGGFGRKADINTGFTRVEWTIIGGEAPIDEEQVNSKGEKLYLEPKEIKKLLEDRAIELEQILKESKNKTPKPKGGRPSLKAIKAEMPTDNPFDVSENPFL